MIKIASYLSVRYQCSSQLVKASSHGSSTKTLHDLGTANQNAVREHATPSELAPSFKNKMNNISALLGKMCILFVHNNNNDPGSDYRLIVVSNRDEFYDRPACNMARWKEDPNVIGGRDLETGCNGGAWLAVTPLRQKLGVLLNLPSARDADGKTRGRLVADFVKSDSTVDDYIEQMKDYAKECKHFNFVAVEIGEHPKVQTYSNFTDKMDLWQDRSFGISNSLPNVPLKKVQAGTKQMDEICTKYKKISDKGKLTEELLALLKSTERHLPDPILEKSKGSNAELFSSIYVHIPERRYGTRTHTIILITKSGHMDIIESTMQAPVDVDNPTWETTEIQCDLVEPHILK